MEHDAPVTEAARQTMLANRGRDTKPELVIRSGLHRAGYRFFVDRPLPMAPRRRADIVFSSIGLYVFIDGCFWHGCPQHFVTPKTRRDFWVQKIEGNRLRDVETDALLSAAGLTPLRIWEHTAPEEAVLLIAQAHAALAAARHRS